MFLSVMHFSHSIPTENVYDQYQELNTNIIDLSLDWHTDLFWSTFNIQTAAFVYATHLRINLQYSQPEKQGVHFVVCFLCRQRNEKEML